MGLKEEGEVRESVSIPPQLTRDEVNKELNILLANVITSHTDPLTFT